MSGPRVVAVGDRVALLDALTGDRVVVLPGVGGYQVAARLDRPDALAAFRAVAGAHAHGSPPTVLVGHSAQVVPLVSLWSPEARRLTDRAWPGPLTVILPVDRDMLGGGGPDDSVRLAMPGRRWLRRVIAQVGPLAAAELRGAGGQPLLTAEEVVAQCQDADIALVVDGGACGGPGPTLVDCTRPTPEVLHVGALPAVYVEAALVMGRQRKKWRP